MDSQEKVGVPVEPVVLPRMITIAGFSDDATGFFCRSRRGGIFRNQMVELTVQPVVAQNHDPDAKRNGRRINAQATALRHTALKRAGFERGLRREDGAVADWLSGNVAVVVYA